MYRWISGYLPNRKARVQVNGKLSKEKTLKEGVPEGGVLSPTLFLIYVNDIIQNLPKHWGSGTPCTQNIPGLHTLEPQFCMYEKHARPTYTRTPIVHVRKTRLAYIHSNPNCPCTQTRPADIYYSAFLPGLPLFRHIPGHRYGTTIDKCTTIDKAPP
ncbi:hypothetical protein RRG08_051995 [Elysia crispata]|uniref:Reverse transcriptase domain-containing protein n=1 Tax=Elysia crispata TaxID=231223 RepID=A0AAE0ZDE1_9GAST|nr:hypothetical protein RRG08_051995 [Elysia crispata]